MLIFEEVESTSDFCRARAEAGEADGLAVMARRQTAGRGSKGREWVSTEGNLFLSVLWRPRAPAREGGLWSLLAGVAVAEAVAPWAGQGLELKWPNDVMLGGGKLAGILVDSAADGDRLEWVVIGIGVNLAVAPEVAGRKVAVLPVQVAAEVAAEAVLGRLDHWRGVVASEGFAPVRAAWLRLGHPIGVAMAVLQGDGSRVLGSFAGLAENGRVLLESGGSVRAFAAGEVSVTGE